MKKTKKGKSAGGAAALVGLIGLFVILYILFLPADIRQDILEGNNSNNNGVTSKVKGKIILEENPGRLDVLSSRHCIGKECSHNINSFRLFMNTDSSELKTFNPFIIKNNILKKSFHKENFDLSNIEYTDNVLLSFNAYYYQGMLTILLNGRVIYEKEINSNNPAPITLPKDILARSNTLEFMVSNVGWQFWKTNEIRIENMKITGDITDVSRQKSNNVFYITDAEFYNVEKGRLKFNPECLQGSVGPLQISINGRELFYSTPVCNDLNLIEFPPAFFEKGENTITFQTEKGSYYIDLIEIRTYLKEITRPVYYFNLNNEDINNLKNNKLNLTANFEFLSHEQRDAFDPEEGDRLLNQDYRLIMTINGLSREIVSKSRTHTRIISYEDVRKENNWIRLEPRGSSIDIVEFKVELVPT
jgi:hypothetical protein